MGWLGPQRCSMPSILSQPDPPSETNGTHGTNYLHGNGDGMSAAGESYARTVIAPNFTSTYPDVNRNQNLHLPSRQNQNEVAQNTLARDCLLIQYNTSWSWLGLLL